MQTNKGFTKGFLSSESGAVTVDWVVLTAALVGLGLASAAVVSAGVEDVSNDTSTQLASTGISTSFGSFFSGAGYVQFGEDQQQAFYDVFYNRDSSINEYGADEALGISEGGAPDAYQLDVARASIQALQDQGQDTSDLEARYETEYERYQASL